MVVVGFDVSKDSIYGARLDRSGTVKERVVLANSEREIEALLTRLKSKFHHLLVASEATAEYHRPLALTCLRLGIPFRLLTPSQPDNLPDRLFARRKRMSVTLRSWPA